MAGGLIALALGALYLKWGGAILRPSIRQSTRGRRHG